MDAIATIQIAMTQDGSVNVSAKTPDPFLIFHMLGIATAQMAAELKKQQGQTIEIANPAIMNRIANLG